MYSIYVYKCFLFYCRVSEPGTTQLLGYVKKLGEECVDLSTLSVLRPMLLISDLILVRNLLYILFGHYTAHRMIIAILVSL